MFVTPETTLFGLWTPDWGPVTHFYPLLFSLRDEGAGWGGAPQRRDVLLVGVTGLCFLLLSSFGALSQGLLHLLSGCISWPWELPCPRDFPPNLEQSPEASILLDEKWSHCLSFHILHSLPRTPQTRGEKEENLIIFYFSRLESLLEKKKRRKKTSSFLST